MSWSERQALMLQAMGLRLWVPAASAEASELETRPQPGAAALAREPVAAVVPPAARPVAVHVVEPDAVTLPAVQPLPATDTAGMDWPALRDAVAACRSCGLCETRTQTVFGAGNPQAHWLIVGEAPGAEEDRRGEPFVGASGQLLDAMLLSLGLSRLADSSDPARSVYIANALKCRPPSNRNPQPREMLQCAPFLQRQIELLQPRVIVAMGRFAAQALLRNETPLGQLRGQVHRVGQCPVVVTYHPSYLLRSPGEKAKAWADLCLAAMTVDSRGP